MVIYSGFIPESRLLVLMLGNDSNYTRIEIFYEIFSNIKIFNDDVMMIQHFWHTFLICVSCLHICSGHFFMTQTEKIVYTNIIPIGSYNPSTQGNFSTNWRHSCHSLQREIPFQTQQVDITWKRMWQTI